MNASALMTAAEELGFSQRTLFTTDALFFSPEVRQMCAAGRCRRYGKSWSCPPACGTPEELEERASRYRRGILVQTTGQMEDDFDYEAIRDTEALHKQRFEALAKRAKDWFPDCMPMAAGTCTHCKACTYPDAPCRFPERMYPSMEACGLLVSEVCRRAGLGYYYGPKTITFTACILTD